MRSWLLYSLGSLLIGLVGCNEVTSSRSVTTDVACHANRQCDLATSTCTSTSDETFTIYEDEYSDGFEHYITSTHHTVIVRYEDVDIHNPAHVLATFQTETLISYIVNDYITIDPHWYEDLSRIATETITITTWQQDCPTCLTWMCTQNGTARETCHIVATIPDLPVCTG